MPLAAAAVAASVIFSAFWAIPAAARPTCSIPVATPSTSAVRLSAVAAICSVDDAIWLMADAVPSAAAVRSSAFFATPWIDRAISSTALRSCSGIACSRRSAICCASWRMTFWSAGEICPQARLLTTVAPTSGAMPRSSMYGVGRYHWKVSAASGGDGMASIMPVCRPVMMSVVASGTGW